VTPSPPRQERSRRTLTRLLDAATELLTEKAGAGFTLHEVADRAGVAVGTVYRRFASKDDLMGAVFDRLRDAERDAATGTWEDADWASMPIRDITDRLVYEMSWPWREQPAYMRANMLRRLSIEEDDSAFLFGVERMSQSMGQFAAIVQSCGRPIAHADVDLACKFAFQMIVGMSARRTARAIETQTPRELDWDELTDQLSDAVARYLFGAGYASL
jgi:AcrR family transcriptional regulator